MLRWYKSNLQFFFLSTPKAFFFVVKEKYVVSCFKVNVFLFWLTTSLDDSRFVRSRSERISYMVLKGKLDVQKQWTRSERKLNSSTPSDFLQVMISSSKKLKDYVRMILRYPKPPLLLIRVIFLWLWALDGENVHSKFQLLIFVGRKRREKRVKKREQKKVFVVKFEKGKKKYSSMKTWQLATSSYLSNLFLWSTVLAIKKF